MKRKKRRAYRRPQVRTERLFERYGLACGKQTAATQQCRTQLKS